MIEMLQKTSYLKFYFFIIFLFNILFFIYIDKIYLQPIFGFFIPMVFVYILLRLEKKYMKFKEKNETEVEDKRIFTKESRTFNSFEDYLKFKNEELAQQHKLQYHEDRDVLNYFNLNPNFTEKDLKKAYYAKMTKIHPDKNQNQGSHEESIKANNYYNKLKKRFKK